jgi:hypothetical protein
LGEVLGEVLADEGFADSERSAPESAAGADLGALSFLRFFAGSKGRRSREESEAMVRLRVTATETVDRTGVDQTSSVEAV